MAMAIESMDHDAVCVASGAEAFKELRSAAFEVVFLDLKLHQESGLRSAWRRYCALRLKPPS